VSVRGPTPGVPAVGEAGPRLAAGLAAFALSDGLGGLSWVRESRGARMDWGGPYALGARLTGPWSVRYREQGAAQELAWSPGEGSQSPGSFRLSRRSGPFRLQEELVVAPDRPQLLVARSLEVEGPEARSLEITTEFAPFLAPVLIEGIRPHLFRLSTRGASLLVESGSLTLAIDSEPLPAALAIDGRPWIGGHWEGPIERLQIVHRVEAGASERGANRILLSAGLRGAASAGGVPPAPDGWRQEGIDRMAAWEARAPSVAVPARPELELAFGLARRALRTLYAQPQPGFTGLLAGLPWYSSLWCRDLATMLPAVLWMGDPDWFAASLDTVFEYQAPADVPILGGAAGELPMQVGPGPIFLYGTSDTSLYFPELVTRYRRHTGELVGPRRWYHALEGVRRWGEAKRSPTTGLFRNGGEVAELRDASETLGPIHLGIDAEDTTIWDSADRRDHAVELQALWLRALGAFAELAEAGEGPAPWRACGAAADRFRAQLVARYRWPEERYLYDSLRADGSPVRHVRPNALLWIGCGLLPHEEERRLLARALRDDLATDWGLRTLSASDPSYDPQVYHMGQVWPITTAWAARAAFTLGDPDTAVELLARSARRIVAEGGFANECYRGDRPEPYNSCFLLGFSVAPFLAAFFEGLWGLVPDLPHATLGIAPRLPSGWSTMELRGLALGAGRLDLVAEPGSVRARWSGTSALRLLARDAELTLAPGTEGRLATVSPAKPS
jgi:hypothetical protein